LVLIAIVVLVNAAAHGTREWARARFG
jgi:hypothetical protein